jgi:hypothetical protein
MMWQRLLYRPGPPEPPPPARDPDLDAVRREQHDLINRVTSSELRRQLRERRVDMRTQVWRRDDA